MFAGADGAASCTCVSVTGCPATVNVVEREDPVVFGATLYVTVPFPLPTAPPVIVTQVAFPDTDQPHDDALAVTEIDAVPPPDAIVCDVGLTVKVHAATVIVTVCPATVSVPMRGVVFELLPTE